MSAPAASPALRAEVERLAERLSREAAACPMSGTLPADEVRALLSLLETQARHLQSLARGEVTL